MDILFFLPTLGYGGTERVVGILAEELAKTHQVGVLTIGKPIPHERELINVHRLTLDYLKDSPNQVVGVFAAFVRLFKLIYTVRHYKPKVILSFLPQCNVLCILASPFFKSTVIVNERNLLRKQSLSKPWVILRRWLYRFAADVWCNSNEIASEIKEQTRCSARITKNPVQFDSKKMEYGKGRKMISVGRLVEQKGFDCLIRSFAISGLQNHGWSLSIFGDGPLHLELQQLISGLDLEQNVELKGYRRIGPELLLDTDIFILCSRFEGFSNAVLEAMSCGVPCILTESARPVGKDLTNMNEAMIVSNDERSIAHGMTQLVFDRLAQREIGEGGFMWSRKYESGRVAREWLEMISEIP